MADDSAAIAVNDPLSQYRAIIGVPSRRRIVFGTACVTFVLTLIVIAFALMSNRDNSQNMRLSYTSFRSALNFSVDPCVDFYNFTCGLWTQNNHVTEDTLAISTFSLLQSIIDKKKKSILKNAEPSSDFPSVVNNAIYFYKQCVQQNSTSGSTDIQLLLDYFNQFGGWPILNKSNWNESAFDLFQYSAFLIKSLDVHTIIGVYSRDNDKNGGKNIIYLKPPTILQDEDTSLSDITFLQMIYVIIKSLNNSHIDPDILEDIENLKIAGTRWKKLLSVRSKVVDPVIMTVEELSILIPEFDWLTYFQLITNDTLLNINETITINDTIAVDSVDYLKKVVNLLNSDNFSKMELANLFGWFVVKNIWILIPEVLRNYANLNNYDSEDVNRAATNKCYDLTGELFSCSLDYLYIKSLSHDGIQDNIALTGYVKYAFQDIIEKSNWLDELSRKSILHRLSKMKNVIGFPSYFNNKTDFDKVYNGFPGMNEYTLGCYFQVVQFYIKIRILHYRITTDQVKVLPRSISDVSAYYIVHKNSFVYPISLHNPPFYYFKGPWYLNFGAIGSIIGHEMMHSIDNTGIQGNSLNVTWLSNTVRLLYKNRTTCFKNQYNVYDNSGLYRNNGTNTLRENIADSEGLRLAFEAYKKHEKDSQADQNYNTLDNYTPDQMFFIAFGSIWCSKSNTLIKEQIPPLYSLNEIRVNKAISNLESFAAAFSCPKGSPMNPIQKCSLW